MRNFSAFGITFSHFGGIKPRTPLQKAILRPQKSPPRGDFSRLKRFYSWSATYSSVAWAAIL